jgi:hypothetical protein
MIMSNQIGQYHRIMTLAKIRGDVGITVPDVMEFMGCNSRSATSYISQCRQKRWLRPEGKRRKNLCWVASAAYDGWLLAQKNPHLAPKNQFPCVAREILLKGHDEDFVPRGLATPTQTLIGSEARVEVYRQRVDQGYEIWHPLDNKDCDPTKAAIQEVKTTKITVSHRKFLAD